MKFLDLFFKRKVSNNQKSIQTNNTFHPEKLTNNDNIKSDANLEMNNAREEMDTNPIYLEKLDNGLLPGEIILLNWIDGATANISFPKYFSYQYGINPDKSKLRLLEQNLIKESTPFETLPSIKVTELKDILKSKDLKVSGRKDDLIKRIEENFNINELEPLIKDFFYKCTEQGNRIIEQYNFIINAHKRGKGAYNVANSIGFISQLKEGEIPTNSQISWKLNNDSYEKNRREKNFGLMRNDILSIAEQLRDDENYHQSITNYIRVFINDLSGLGNQEYLEPPSSLFLAPGIVNPIIDMLKEVDDNIEELFEYAWEITKEELPFHYFNEKVCYQLLLDAINADNVMDIEDKVQDKAEKVIEKYDKSTFENKFKGVKYPITLDL
ncbi:SAP domain-containing protein [Gracilibacillus oryzae]|uniref:SAP domain-containing protein n=1 Tax=Gracilibacillus oryzae TaxID=1672701 RepID=A0A7C8L0S0_9BACI|nr:SAP domain-containing protein [Gracilibacillus oryzae]KAB8139075.1 SAP domain-containing protein [Gracilibacillus oryzae]